jgi:uroporphyrinogen decarboxylase
VFHLRELDIAQFWKDDEIAHRDNCFYKGPQTALGIRMSAECVYAELGEEGNPWLPEERSRYLDLAKRYNDRAEKIVGKRLLNENLPPLDAAFPEIRRIGEVFGGEYTVLNNTEWLGKCFDDEEQLEKKLDEVLSMDFRAFMLPKNWETEKRRIYETYGIKPSPLRHIRGPVTLACSLMGNEELIFLILDHPRIAEKFSRAIAHAAISMARVCDEEAGITAKSHPGFSFADDSSCLLTPDMYEFFGYPVLRDVFSVFSPNPNDSRYQHSDSPMAHLLPILGRLDLNGVNFGPTVMVPEIRKYLPRARIDGCIAPFTFMRNDRDALIAETTRDCEADEIYGGVNISTAGSINNGSSLESMRLIMQVIQNRRK